MEKNKMQLIYCILYFLFICCGFLFGQLYLPGSPLNNLQILTLLMLAICIFLDKKLPCDKYLKFYYFFICVFFVSELITGYVERFISFFLTYLFIGYVFYWATKILIVKYKTIKPLIFATICIGVIDSCVTISQALGFTITNPLIEALVVDESVQEYIDLHSDGMGIALSGLYMSAVTNGHNLLFFYLISLLTIYNGNKKTLFLMPSFVILVGLFYCQQRSPFYIALFLSSLLMARKYSFSPLKMFLMIVVLLFICIWILPIYLGYVETSGSRMLSDDDTNRFDIWSNCLLFFMDHPILGGYHNFVATYKAYPHNLILSVLISSGILGFFFFLRMIWGQINFLIFHIKMKSQNMFVLTVVFCYTGLVLDSLSHNTGWVDGDLATFICWSMCYYLFSCKLSGEKGH